MKSKAELAGEIAMLIVSPGRKIAGCVASPAAKIAGCIKAIADRQEGGEAGEAAAPAA